MNALIREMLREERSKLADPREACSVARLIRPRARTAEHEAHAVLFAGAADHVGLSRESHAVLRSRRRG